MERFNLDAVEAFDLLARLSRQSNTELIDIADFNAEVRGRGGAPRSAARRVRSRDPRCV